ncbi:MAG: hypothetical protein RBS95_03940 [Desulfobulbus sp.]|nr:hypothetical protein [Desulfobulbus sp.]
MAELTDRCAISVKHTYGGYVFVRKKDIHRLRILGCLKFPEARGGRGDGLDNVCKLPGIVGGGVFQPSVFDRAKG